VKTVLYAVELVAIIFICSVVAMMVTKIMPGNSFSVNFAISLATFAVSQSVKNANEASV
jgi:hypothetical protein